MDIEFFEIVFATIGALALALGIIIAIRTKSIVPGLTVFIYFFLCFVLIFGVFGLIYVYDHYASDLIRILIGGLISMIGFLTMGGAFLVWGRRSKKAGNLVINGQEKTRI